MGGAVALGVAAGTQETMYQTCVALAELGFLLHWLAGEARDILL